MIISLLSGWAEVSPDGSRSWGDSEVFRDVPADSVGDRPVVTDGLASTDGTTGMTIPELVAELEFDGPVEVSPNVVPVSG